MTTPSAVIVKVPATTANLGPGFDCIGAALTLYNQFRFTRLEGDVTDQPCKITVSGLEAERVRLDGSNLAYQAFMRVYQYLGQDPPPVQIDVQLGIPLARGLGSSATAIAAGAVAANSLAGVPLDRHEILKLAIQLEGHPDNVVPALMGGCRLAATATATAKAADHEWIICDVPWHPGIIPILAIPDFELSTQQARQLLPTGYSQADTIFNTAHLGLLLRGLETGQPSWLCAALQDRVHQPYRQILIPGYDAVRAAAIAAGAHGLVISGAGPTLLALADSSHSQSVQSAMTNAWLESGISALVMILKVDEQGTTVNIHAPTVPTTQLL
jgi:homoserine kinase